MQQYPAHHLVALYHKLGVDERDTVAVFACEPGLVDA